MKAILAWIRFKVVFMRPQRLNINKNKTKINMNKFNNKKMKNVVIITSVAGLEMMSIEISKVLSKFDKVGKRRDKKE